MHPDWTLRQLLTVGLNAASASPRRLPAELFQRSASPNVARYPPNPHVHAIPIAAMSLSVPSRRLIRSGKTFFTPIALEKPKLTPLTSPGAHGDPDLLPPSSPPVALPVPLLEQQHSLRSPHPHDPVQPMVLEPQERQIHLRVRPRVPSDR